MGLIPGPIKSVTVWMQKKSNKQLKFFHLLIVTCLGTGLHSLSTFIGQYFALKENSVEK